MPNSGSVLFPFQEDIQTRALKRSTTIAQVFNSAIKSYILTDPMSRFGNPIGSSIPQLIHRLVPDEEIGEIEDDIQAELAEQFTEIEILNVTLESIDKVSWKISIVYTSTFTDIVDLELIIQN